EENMNKVIFVTILPLLIYFFNTARSDVLCPKMPSGVELYCANACCVSNEGISHGYYCCQLDSPNVLKSIEPVIRAESLVATYTPGTFQLVFSDYFLDILFLSFPRIDYTLLVLGLIISIVLSVLLSFFAAYFVTAAGFSVVFSTHPPQFRSDEMYGGSSISGASRGGASRVRFNEDGTPRGWNWRWIPWGFGGFPAGGYPGGFGGGPGLGGFGGGFGGFGGGFGGCGGFVGCGGGCGYGCGKK
ncbi:hypothetical protein Mgra_00009217, partial [Meloidogyne graminicola]